MENPYRIRFLGGAGTVSGSKYLITNDQTNVLIDCGLFQGLKELRLKNWDRFPIDPRKIDAVVLTHAHIDHSGFIPRIIQEGFRGPIYCTPATFALCKILLPDTGYLQEEEAEWLKRKKISKHNPPLPLFTLSEAEKSLDQFKIIEFDEPFLIAGNVTARFRYAGHILGAASIHLQIGKRSISFSGDIGRRNDPLMRPPATLLKSDFLVVESTYGNRLHQKSDPANDLKTILDRAVLDRSVVIVPAFAVGRAQSVLYYLSLLKRRGELPKMPLYLNSPMATNVTKLFEQFQNLHKLSTQECAEMCEVVHYVKSVEESVELNKKSGPMLIISASGMATGGRVIHHLKQFVSDPKNTVLFTGFQAAGTRGRAMLDGAKEIKIHGQMIPIHAKVLELENLSAHADMNEILEWLTESNIQPGKVFVTHGEVEASQQMKAAIESRFGWKSYTPKQDQEFLLS